MPDVKKFALTGLLPGEITERLGIEPFRGRQIFEWIHKKRIFDFAAMTNLSKELRAKLEMQCLACGMELAELKESAEAGTRKVLLRLADGETVESVLIRDEGRITLCVSSQVGCPLKCAFCATGLAGFTRNLTAGEIVEQVLWLLKDVDLENRTPNIVYMGMGEPFRNYDHVLQSMRLLMAHEGLNIGARKITVSTAGEAKEIERFANEGLQVRLSVSLHAANNELRSRLVPLNRRYPLETLRSAVENYLNIAGRQITFEWTLLDGVNDTVRDAGELIDYCRGLKAFVNLIPWNPVEGLGFRPSPRKQAMKFRDLLVEAGIPATLRQEKGQDIDAACGQLRRTHGAGAAAIIGSDPS